MIRLEKRIDMKNSEIAGSFKALEYAFKETTLEAVVSGFGGSMGVEVFLFDDARDGG